MRRLFLLLTILLLPATGRAQDRVRPAIERILPLLERAAAGSADQRECYTCHNQGLPILALSEARRHGFTIDAANFQRQVDHTYAHLNRNRDRYTKGEGTGGKADTAGSALWALSAGEYSADETTAAVAEFLLLWQAEDNRWSCSSDRPPSEASDFTTTYLSLRGLTAYGTDAQRDRIALRTQSAKDWLINTAPEDNEDRVFRLWALQLAEAEESIIAEAAADLISRQQADGGWSQLDEQPSDAYATATALVALHETGSLQPSDGPYQRGVEYLLNSQLEDGSWHIVSRSKPFQMYFETGFPHGTDQFISSAATAWGALALLAACPAAAQQPSAAEIKQFPFEVRESAGVRRRNDVVTVRATQQPIVEHKGGIRVLHDGKPLGAQVRRVEWPGESPAIIVDFIDHFKPFEAREYVLELQAEPTGEEPTGGLTLTETDEAWQVDSSGLVDWTIRKDLAGLFDFSWKETDYVANDSAGLWFSTSDGAKQKLSERAPTRAGVDRSGPIAVGLRFDYDDWPPGGHSSVKLEFPRTKSWIHATWTIDGTAETAQKIGADLNLRLDGPEALLDFKGGDFVYATVTKDQAARLEAGPRIQITVPWKVLHGPADAMEPIFISPQYPPSTVAHGWAHVMDDKRCTALAIGKFGEASADAIDVDGHGRLSWTRTFVPTNAAPPQPRTFEFWLHFVTMPVHIGARTSPRSMQEPLVVRWLAE
jgi:hypothetical protein